MKPYKIDKDLINETGYFLEEFKSSEILNFKVSRFSLFKNDIWDFSYTNKENRATNNSLIKFIGVPKEFKFYTKLHALKQIKIDNNALSTVNKNIDILRTVGNEFISRGIKSILTVSVDEIKNYLNYKEQSNSFSYLERVTGILKSYFTNTGEFEGINYDRITRFLIERQQKYMKYERKSAANEYIPDAFYNQIVSCAIQDSKNANLKPDDRIVACLLIILAETGMRAEELSHLKTGQLSTYKVNDGKKVHYLNFKTFKTVQTSNRSETTQCYMTEKAVNAYKMAEKLVSTIINNLSEFVLYKRIYELETNQLNLSIKHLNKQQTSVINQLTPEQFDAYKRKLGEYIFISKHGKRRVGTPPLTENYYKFIIRNYDYLVNVPLNSKERENLNYLQVMSESRYIKFFDSEYRKNNTFKETKTIRFPYVNFHRFRTTVCTKLFKQKVHIDFIMKHMNHISADMTNYYNKSYQQENELEKSMEHIQGLIDQQGLLITNKEDVSEVYLKNELELNSSVKKIEKINDFLISNNLNIRRDVKEVLKILKKTNSPAVENEFGMCLRSIIHSVCERRKYFHTFDDNYNVEVNLNTYKFLNFEYERFQQKIEIVRYNKALVDENPTYSVEFDREVKVLKRFVDNVLMKQLETLNKDINLLGESTILEQHPNLKEVIKNRLSILNEVSTWRN